MTSRKLAKALAIASVVMIAQLFSDSAQAGIVYIGNSVNSVDSDADGVFDLVDNAPTLTNPLQSDTDGDGIGDARDPSPTSYPIDQDGDGVDHASDVNDTESFARTFLPEMTGPQVVVPTASFSISLGVAVGVGSGTATGLIDTATPDHLIVELRVDDVALAGSSAAH